ncbi:hypothetical protein M9H77_21582 [Catharanthus roseus]|uniref:Uncharacterized protein n=1 Tax=Catharanthus roseus TaxID=4058 RepID=A0ACC0AN44_CATRO|nr:hypothetical protein M9H77_21582 [Catharanthus roseus]
MDLWKLDNNFEMLNIEGGFFVVRFRFKEDYAKVLEGGPWMALGHHLSNKSNGQESSQQEPQTPQSDKPIPRADLAMLGKDKSRDNVSSNLFVFGLGESGSHFQVLDTLMAQQDEESTQVQRLKEVLQTIPEPPAIPKPTSKKKSSGFIVSPKNIIGTRVKIAQPLKNAKARTNRQPLKEIQQEQINVGPLAKGVGQKESAPQPIDNPTQVESKLVAVQVEKKYETSKDAVHQTEDENLTRLRKLNWEISRNILEDGATNSPKEGGTA